MESSRKTPPNEYRGQVFVATAVAYLAIDVLSVALRFWSRRRQWLKHGIQKFRIDDFFIIAALVTLTGLCIDCIYAVKLGGAGHHIQYVSKQERIHWLKIAVIAAPILHHPSASFPRLAIIYLYLKLFQDRAMKLCCWAIALVLAAQPVACVLVITLQCRPLSFLWDKTIPGGHCINQAYLFRYGTLPNIIIDFAMLVLPLPLIRKLQASLKVKIGLLITFLSGSIGLITATLRFVAFFSPQLVDGPWTSVEHLGWAIIEPSIYLIAACLLTIKPLLIYLNQQIGLFQWVQRSWFGVSITRSKDTRIPDRVATWLPGDDGKSEDKIHREHVSCVERGFGHGDDFALHSISTASEQ